MPLRAGDYFVVNEQPIKVDSIYYKSTDLANSYVTLNGIKYTLSGYDNISAANRKGDDILTTNTTGPYFLGYDNTTTDANIIWENVAVSTNQGSQDVNISMTSGDYMTAGSPYASEDVIYVLNGADNVVNSDYYTLSWTNPTWNYTNGTGAHRYTYQNNTNLVINYKASGTPTGTISYVKSGDYWGIRVSDGTNNVIDQAQEKASEDRYTYEELAYANYEATDSATVKADIFKEDAKVRATLTPGVSTTDSATSNAYTVTSDKTFPYAVTSDVTVNELTCAADAVSTGVTFGNVASDLVVSPAVVPTGNAIVIGGHYVNTLAVGHTEQLTKAGDMMDELSGNTLYVAGYTAQDTASAVDELIAAIKAL